MSSLYFSFVRWLHRFDEWPHYNCFGSGLYHLLWSQWCGYGWKFAWRQCSRTWFGDSRG